MERNELVEKILKLMGEDVLKEEQIKEPMLDYKTNDE